MGEGDDGQSILKARVRVAEHDAEATGSKDCLVLNPGSAPRQLYNPRQVL